MIERLHGEPLDGLALVIPAEFLNTTPVQAVLDMAVSAPFQAELEALGGYDSTRAGTVVAEIPA